MRYQLDSKLKVYERTNVHDPTHKKQSQKFDKSKKEEEKEEENPWMTKGEIEIRFSDEESEDNGNTLNKNSQLVNNPMKKSETGRGTEEFIKRLTK